MPLYEYECGSCGERLETIQRFSDPPLTECPDCSGALTRLISAPAFQFKGSGWYVTDYARAGAKGGGGESSKDAKTETKASGDGKAEAGSSTSKSAETKTAKASAGKGDDG